MEKQTDSRTKISAALAIAGALILILPYLVPRRVYVNAMLEGFNDNPNGNNPWWILAIMGSSLVGAAMLGGGIGNYFNRKWTGVACGLAAIIAFNILHNLFFP